MIAIDPGTRESGFIVIEKIPIISSVHPSPYRFLDHGIEENEKLLKIIRKYSIHPLAIEFMRARGMPMGNDQIDTIFWTGRMVQVHSGPYYLVDRKDVKMHLCGTTKAKDTNIRQALINRFGKPGNKACPGLLYKIRSHCLAALAVGITAWETPISSKED